MNLDYKKAALLIIDMQKGFVEPGAALCVPTAKATIPAINSVIDKCREEGAKIVWVKREYAADGSDVEIPRRKALEESGLLGVLAPGTTGINSPEDAEGLMPLEGETTIIKPRFSSFLKTGLDEMLRSEGIDTIIVTGTTTPNCIRATAFDGISYDYRTIVVEDCCSAKTEEIQRVNMEDMARVGVEIIDSGELIK
ncbi:MAG: cysteine hydrolase [Firmicutes bacterium]|nr:cysteine hydrolase [Bacillota bacterium]